MEHFTSTGTAGMFARDDAGGGDDAGGVEKAYVRERDLPGLITLWPHEITAAGQETTKMLISRIERALRAERRRGRAGHWSYDLARHLALVRAHKRECELLWKARRDQSGEKMQT